ncbi:GrpB family protein [Rubellicoccus peritrichatus]|uniref:GrpB family protein n=1 Tax=Rubellicoccus peritrichatus TaxID=3080537 RepID=A0AAQ3QVW1_9BACT|nr:GrpB family protein [Puniceicoccus sp. CR14]WOO41310.1 GrpB family protein [Puniceicoccus sp. CR14]
MAAMQVLVVPHKAEWRDDFKRESALIGRALDGLTDAIHHIGSTSIPGIYAKPIIDIMVEVSHIAEVDSRNPAMEELGYECMGEFGIEGRRFFRKDNKKGIRTHHVHIFETKSSHVIRHLAFRNYLIEHSDVALEYSSMKQKLVCEHPEDMESYIAGKDPFIKRVEQDALEWLRLKNTQ